MNIYCGECGKEYELHKEGSIRVIGETLSYGVPEEVLMYDFCSKDCLVKCHEYESDKLLEKYL
jgi:hypothetical protein